MFGIAVGLFLLESCNNKKVSPNDKLIGIYDRYWGQSPDNNGDFMMNGSTVVIEKKSYNFVEITFYGIYDIRDNKIKTIILPTCEIFQLDTTGEAGNYFAKIVDAKTNNEIGKAIDFTLQFNSLKRSDLIRTKLYFNFWTEDSLQLFNYYAIKRRE